MDQRGESARVATLRSLGVLDTPAEERFDRIVRLAQHVFDVPYAAVNLIDESRQWSKSRTMSALPQQVPRSESFCELAIQRPETLIVPDARQDDRFSSKAVVQQGPRVRFYAGQPLTVNGHRVGSLCLADSSPRVLSERQVKVLGELGRWTELELARTRELWQAAEVQRRLLPVEPPEVTGVQVAGQCVQSNAVGGDFFDWFLTDGKLQVVLADVMGKGLSAAIHAAGVRASLRTAGHFNSLTETVRKAAYSVAEDLEGSGAFVTAFLARVDTDSGRMEYIDAGHGLAIVLEPGGTCRRLADIQPPLGVDPDHGWYVQETVLGPGETLVAVSDGFLDFFRSGQDAMDVAIEVGAQSTSAEDLVERFIEYAVTRVPRDDVSVVAVRRSE